MSTPSTTTPAPLLTERGTGHGIGTVELGDSLLVSAQGFGAMGLTGSYGSADDNESLRTINHAIDSGITLLDTADIYGAGANERLLSSVLRTRRDQVVLASKFGFVSGAKSGEPKFQGDPDYVRRSLDASLTRLDVDHIDLYYYHRVDPRVEIEETVGALAALVAVGKIKHIGLSEVTARELERANAIHPIAAVQSEFSLFSRDVEGLVLPTARGLGVGFVAYAPLGRGFLTGAVASSADLGVDDARHHFPRFATERIAANQALVAVMGRVATAESISPAQVALAWVHERGRALGVAIVPIPGTRRAARIDENLAAATHRLSPASLEALEDLAVEVSGDRNGDPLSISQGREAREHPAGP